MNYKYSSNRQPLTSYHSNHQQYAVPLEQSMKGSNPHLMKKPFSQKESDIIFYKKDRSFPNLLSYQETQKDINLPNYEPTKFSSSHNGIIKAYAANTNQGIVRNYNEDRVSIILNIVKPQNRISENWPRCSFFGVYDGHGGAACADFLRDNLHQFVIQQPEFPFNPIEALKKGFDAAERTFIDMALESYKKGTPENSGSCAIVGLFIGDKCYIANVGDSRAVLSLSRGNNVITVSNDHKPNSVTEKARILKAGGKLFQTPDGPTRVLPGRLSVSRTFGDIEAKLAIFNGNPQVVISDPEIKSFYVTKEHDFLILACDGVFDEMSSSEVLAAIWKEQTERKSNIHSMVKHSVESVIKECMNRKSLDNITVVMIAFNDSTEENQENLIPNLRKTRDLR